MKVLWSNEFHERIPEVEAEWRLGIGRDLNENAIGFRLTGPNVKNGGAWFDIKKRGGRSFLVFENYFNP